MGERVWRVDTKTTPPTGQNDADGGSSRDTFHTLVRTVPDAVVHLDDRCTVVAVDDDLLDLTGLESDSILGKHVSSLLADEDVSRLDAAIRDHADEVDTVATLDVAVHHANGSRVPCELRIGTRTDDGAFTGAVCVVSKRGDEITGADDRAGTSDSDVHGRYSRAIFEAARDAMLIADDEGTYVDANSAASELLGQSREALVGRSITAFTPDTYDVEETWDEFRKEGSHRGTVPLRRSNGEKRLVEYAAVADVRPGRHLVVMRDVTESRRRERQIERQREQLEALNHLNTVVRAINDAIVERSTREDIERAACESLAESPSYEFAFVAEIDAQQGAVLDRVEAGVENYVEDVPLSTDPDEPAGRGPLGQAVRTGEIQVSSDVLADPDFEPWHEDARERGYRAAAAIPITYDGTLYGILGIATARVGAFTGEEHEVVGQLGEQLGHAIAALDRKRALMNDELVELEFAVRDVFERLDVAEPTDERITFEGAVPISDDEFLTYGTTTTDALPAVRGLEGRAPHWGSVTVLDESPTELRFEVHMVGPSVYSLVASHGGYIDEAAIDDGDFVLTIHLLQGTDVRNVTEAVQEAYPGARNVARRQVRRQRRSARELQRSLSHELTPRQRTVLEIAHYGGYFEWPRDSSGEDLADRLDVSPATFHQHLRAAERKLFRALLE